MSKNCIDQFIPTKHKLCALLWLLSTTQSYSLTDQNPSTLRQATRADFKKKQRSKRTKFIFTITAISAITMLFFGKYILSNQKKDPESRKPNYDKAFEHLKNIQSSTDTKQAWTNYKEVLDYMNE